MKKKLKIQSHSKTKKQHDNMKSTIGGSPRNTRKRSMSTPYDPDDEYTPPKSRRTSRRISGEHLQTTVEIGTGNSFITKDIIQTAVNKLNPGVPTIVSLPLPPERHAFLVYIDENEKSIKFADWGIRGLDPTQPKKRRNEKQPAFNKKMNVWKRMRNFYEFIELLTTKFPYEITYYPVDEVLFEAAEKKHDTHHGSGGCSEYIYEWIDKHFPDGKTYTP
uniref:Uncharacterized protein n=1 Tax=viral metagenome TaxID=1070528 RepID=A0A6C0HUB4_9ZZZZ